MLRRLAVVAMIAGLLQGCAGDDTPTPAGPSPTGRVPAFGHPARTVDPRPLEIRVPGFPPMPVPEDNPTTLEGVALGRRLFFDPILSGDSTQACASCHAPAFAFSDHGRRFSLGIDGSLGTRNAPALVNVGWNQSNFWDGRAKTLEDQALEPVVNPIEMKNTWETVVERLQAHAEYPGYFASAFGSSEITPRRVVQAIAQFERTLVSNNSKYDRFLRGRAMLSAAELRGLGLFLAETGDCFHCHDERLFSVGDFRDIGLDSLPPDPGRGAATGDPRDVGKFKIPTLRNIELTAPYMHDGRFATLEEVLDHYDSGGVHSANVDPLIRVGRGLGLTPRDKEDIIAFLKTLTDTSFVHAPQFANPFE